MMNNFMEYLKDKKITQLVKENRISQFLSNRVLRNNPIKIKDAVNAEKQSANNFVVDATKMAKKIVKNTAKVMKKPILYTLLITACVATLASCAPVDDKVVDDQHINVASELSQEDRDMNRWLGKLFGIDRGNIIETEAETTGSENENDNEIIINTPDKTIEETKQNQSEESSIPSDTENNNENNPVDDNLNINTNPNFIGGNTGSVDRNEHNVEKPNKTTPEDNITTPDKPSKPEQTIVEIPSTEPTADEKLLIEFDAFAQACLMIQLKDPTNAKFDSLKINNNDTATFVIICNDGNKLSLDIACPKISSISPNKNLTRKNASSDNLIVINALRDALGTGSLEFIDEPSM